MDGYGWVEIQTCGCLLSPTDGDLPVPNRVGSNLWSESGSARTCAAKILSTIGYTNLTALASNPESDEGSRRPDRGISCYIPSSVDTMKFGALLRSSAQVMPELQGLFNCYKQLKKRLKRLPEKGVQAVPADNLLQGSSAVKAHERAFVALLVSDIQAFNETFVEREEQSVIKLSLIEQRNTPNLGPNELAALYKVH